MATRIELPEFSSNLHKMSFVVHALHFHVWFYVHLILISFLLLEYYHCDLLLWFIDVRLTHLINITYLLISIISRLADVYFIVLLGIIYLHHTQYKHSVSRFICKSHINSINSRWDYRWLGKFRPHLTAIKRYAGSRSPGGLCQRDRLVFWYIYTAQ